MHKELRYAIEPNIDKDNFKWEDIVSLAENTMIPYGKHTSMDIKDQRSPKPLQWFISIKIIRIKRKVMEITNKENNTHQGKET